ncbi:MAG: hypothetical protein KGI59_00770 [Patescibacteria group bacterium]|nr:hypothetical protein [Patescibacteria group bacterium]
MIELTTGVVFLMSSLYGSGQPAQVASATVTSGTNTVAESTTTDTTATSTSTLSSGTDTNTSAMQAYLKNQFGADSILVDIARCESNFHQFDKAGNVVRGIVNNADVGVMQINEKYHADTAKKLGLDLYTVEGNVAYAKHLYAEEGTAPWASSQKCWGGDLAAK